MMYLKTFICHTGKFDFGECPETEKFYAKGRKKVIGKMKDETKCFSVLESAGLMSKIHSFVLKRDKGIRYKQKHC